MLPEDPEYAKVQFHMMTLLDVVDKIAWVRYDFLSQGKISNILIRCARTKVLRETLKSPFQLLHKCNQFLKYSNFLHLIEHCDTFLNKENLL